MSYFKHWSLLVALCCYGGMISCTHEQVADEQFVDYKNLRSPSDIGSGSGSGDVGTVDKMLLVKGSELLAKLSGKVKEFAPSIPSETLETLNKAQTAQQDTISTVEQARAEVTKQLEDMGAVKEDGHWKYAGQDTETFQKLVGERNEFTNKLKKLRKIKYQKDLQDLKDGVREHKESLEDIGEEVDDAEESVNETREATSELQEKVDTQNNQLKTVIVQLDAISEGLSNQPSMEAPQSSGEGVSFQQKGSAHLGGGTTAQSSFQLNLSGKGDISVVVGQQKYDLPQTETSTNYSIKFDPQQRTAKVSTDGGRRWTNLPMQQQEVKHSGVSIEGSSDSAVSDIEVSFSED